MVSGVGALDYDNDGWLDIYLVNGATMPRSTSAAGHWNRLCRNLGGWLFEDVTERAGVKGTRLRPRRRGRGLRQRRPQGPLRVRACRQNALYRNKGDGSFTDVTCGWAARPIRSTGRCGRWRRPSSTTTATAGWTSSSRTTASGTRRPSRCAGPGGRGTTATPALRGLPNSLYRNNGDGTFARRLGARGSARTSGRGWGSAWPTSTTTGGPTSSWRTTTRPLPLQETTADGTFAESGFEAGVAYTRRAAARGHGRGCTGHRQRRPAGHVPDRARRARRARCSGTMVARLRRRDRALRRATSFNLRAPAGANAIFDSTTTAARTCSSPRGGVLAPGGRSRRKCRQTNPLLPNLGDAQVADAYTAGAALPTRPATTAGLLSVISTMAAALTS